MLHENRKRMILDILNEKKFVKTGELQKLLQVTEMTVWRDLKELENMGTIRRIRGGAELIHPRNGDHILHTERLSLHLDEKRLIGKKAAALIQDKDIIFISSGTTNEFIKEYIRAKDIRIVTNSACIFRQYVEDPDFDAILVGGKFDRISSSFLGAIANDVINTMTFHKAFMGANGITLRACCASNDEEGMFYRIVLHHSTQKYVVCDTTKFNKDAFYKYYPCDKLTAIITDDGMIENKEEFEQETMIL